MQNLAWLLLLFFGTGDGFLGRELASCGSRPTASHSREGKVLSTSPSSSSSSSYSPSEPSKLRLTSANVSAYEAHWSRLLNLELSKAMTDVQARLKTWSRQRLEEEGLAVFRLSAQPDGELFGEKLVLLVPADRDVAAAAASAATAATQEVLAGNAAGNAEGLPSDQASPSDARFSHSSSGGGGASAGYAGGIFRRFSPGDVVSLSSSGPRRPRAPLTLAISGGGSLGSGNEGIVSEALVVDKGANWLQVSTGKSWPKGIWEGRRQQKGGGHGISAELELWRVDKIVSASAHERMMSAVKDITAAATIYRGIDAARERERGQEAEEAAAAVSSGGKPKEEGRGSSTTQQIQQSDQRMDQSKGQNIAVKNAEGGTELLEGAGASGASPSSSSTSSSSFNSSASSVPSPPSPSPTKPPLHMSRPLLHLLIGSFLECQNNNLTSSYSAGLSTRTARPTLENSDSYRDGSSVLEAAELQQDELSTMSIEDELKAASAVEILDTYEMGPAMAVPSREPTDQIAADGADAGSSKDADASRLVVPMEAKKQAGATRESLVAAPSAATTSNTTATSSTSSTSSTAALTIDVSAVATPGSFSTSDESERTIRKQPHDEALSTSAWEKIAASAPEGLCVDSVVVSAVLDYMDSLEQAAAASKSWSRIDSAAAASSSSSGSNNTLSGGAVRSASKVSINDPQRNVVREAIVRRCSLIQGPPGTGKTIVVSRLVQAAILLQRMQRQLDLKALAKKSGAPDDASSSSSSASASSASASFLSSPTNKDSHGANANGNAQPLSENEKEEDTAYLDWLLRGADTDTRRGTRVLAVAATNAAADLIMNKLVQLRGMSDIGAVRLGRAATVAPHLRNRTLDALVERHPDVIAARRALEKAAAADAKAIADAAKKKRDGQKGGGEGLRSRSGSSSSSSGSGGVGPHAGASVLGGGDREDPSLRAATVAASSQLSLALRQSSAAILRAADVVVSNCIASRHEVLRAAFTGDDGSPPIDFATVVIDEASQATEPSVLVPLTSGCRQLIFVGDQQQLPPTVTSLEASQGGLSLTPFVRLLRAGVQPLLLTNQYRMSRHIAEFPSRYFYGGRLVTMRRGTFYGGGGYKKRNGQKPHQRRRRPWPESDEKTEGDERSGRREKRGFQGAGDYGQQQAQVVPLSLLSSGAGEESAGSDLSSDEESDPMVQVLERSKDNPMSELVTEESYNSDSAELQNDEDAQYYVRVKFRRKRWLGGGQKLQAERQKNEKGASLSGSTATPEVEKQWGPETESGARNESGRSTIRFELENGDDRGPDKKGGRIVVTEGFDVFRVDASGVLVAEPADDPSTTGALNSNATLAASTLPVATERKSSADQSGTAPAPSFIPNEGGLNTTDDTAAVTTTTTTTTTAAAGNIPAVRTYKEWYPRGFPWPRNAFPVAFVPIRCDTLEGDEQLSPDRASYVNPTEAGAVVDVVRMLLIVGRVMPHQIVVLASYNGQVQLIRNLLAQEAQSGRTRGAGGVEVATVDGFQGRERAVILFSTVRSNPNAKLGFMGDGRRLNVALTRARQAIIILGDDVTLRSGSKHWAAYLTWLEEQRAVFGRRGLTQTLANSTQNNKSVESISTNSSGSTESVRRRSFDNVPRNETAEVLRKLSNSADRRATYQRQTQRQRQQSEKRRRGGGGDSKNSSGA